MTRRDVLRSLAAGWVVVRSTATGGVRFPAQSATELLIRRGRIVNADGARTADVRVVGETIAEIGTGLRPGTGARVIEAAGRLIMPGGIDPHTHLHPSFVDDFTSGSVAALAGGITTVGTFATVQQNETMIAAIERLAGRVRTEAIADVILHVSAWPPTPEVAASLPDIAAAGQPSFKIYMLRADFGAQLQNTIRLLEAARAAGVVTMVHCEDGALLGAAVRRLQAQNRTTLRDYSASRPVLAEVAATQQIAALCESTGAPVHIVHLSSARALEACKQARAAGAPLFVETRPLYLHLTEEKMQRPDAPLFVGQPPLRTVADRTELWRAMIDGRIDVLATDHAPWRREQKLDPALSITRLRPGVSDLQFMLPMYFSEGVGKRRLPLPRFVETTSTNAARIFGLYPKKGVIQVGSDADFAIWDPNRTATVSAEADHSKSDYSVYEGWNVTGWPVTTIRRGEVVYDDGRVLGQAGTGRLISRERWR
ncbi:MAG: amidohydrolase family protein [Gemmatimonadota bacterium]